MEIVEVACGSHETVQIARRRIVEAGTNCGEGEEEEYFDPYFFDKDYTVAGSTGFMVWEGGRRMAARITDLLEDAVRRRNNKGGKLKCIELGAGSGVAGISAAKACGAHVLLTDLEPVVNEALRLSIEANCQGKTNNGWHRVGSGACATAVIDWERYEYCFHSYQCETSIDPRAELDVVLSAESVWLKDTFVYLLQSPDRPVGYICTRNRANEESQCFANPSEVLEELRSKQCDVSLKFDEESAEEPGKRVFFYEIRYVDKAVG